MKLLLLLLVTVSIGTIYGLRSDLQKKLVNDLNRDRKEVGDKLGIKFETVTYDPSLEEAIDAYKGCIFGDPQKLHIIPLDWNDNVDLYNVHADQLPRLMFFQPDKTKIGCSTKFRCSMPPEAKSDDNTERDNLKFYGACSFGTFEQYEDITPNIKRKIYDAGLPEVQKYGAIIGVRRKD